MRSRMSPIIRKTYSELLKSGEISEEDSKELKSTEEDEETSGEYQTSTDQSEYISPNLKSRISPSVRKAYFEQLSSEVKSEEENQFLMHKQIKLDSSYFGIVTYTKKIISKRYNVNRLEDHIFLF